MGKTLEKATQTYDKYCLGAKIEEMIYKILKNEAKCKYFIGLFPEQFNILLLFLEKQNMLWIIGMLVAKGKINVH